MRRREVMGAVMAGLMLLVACEAREPSPQLVAAPATLIPAPLVIPAAPVAPASALPAGVGLPPRASFIEAAVTVGCNDLDLALDMDQRSALRRQVLMLYGFTEETWEEASRRLRDDPTVRPVVESRVSPEACAARSAPARRDDLAAPDAPDAGAAEIAPALQDAPAAPSGVFRGAVKGGGVRGTVMLSLRPGRLSGNARGTLDGGERWSAGLSGEVRGTTFSGQGRSPGGTLWVQGRFTQAKATGTLSGTINGKAVSANFTATPP